MGRGARRPAAIGAVYVVLVWVIHIQFKSLQRHIERCQCQVNTLISSEARRRLFAEADWLKNVRNAVAKFNTDWASRDLTIDGPKEYFLSRAQSLLLDAQHYEARRKDLLVNADIYLSCEVLPIKAKVEYFGEAVSELRERSYYVKMWVAGETTAPAIEVLL